MTESFCFARFILFFIVEEEADLCMQSLAKYFQAFVFAWMSIVRHLVGYGIVVSGVNFIAGFYHSFNF